MDDIEKMLEEMGKRKDMGELDTEFVDDVEKQRILNRTMEKIKIEREKEQTKERKKLARWQKNLAAVAASLALIITVVLGGTAAAGVNLNTMLRNYFGADETANPAQVKKMISMSDAKAVSGEVEMTVTQIIGDDTGFSAVLRAKKVPDILEELKFRDTNVEIPANKDMEVEWSEPEIITNSEEYTTIMFHVSSKNITGKDILVSLKDIGYTNEKGKFVTAVKGKWNLKWTLDYTDEAQETEVGRSVVRANGAKATWESVSISPLSVTVKLKETQAGKTHMTEKEWEKTESRDRLVVVLKDGTRIDSRFVMNDESGQFDEYDDSITMGFHKIIKPENIASVSLGKEKCIMDSSYQEPQKVRFTSKAAGFTLDMSPELSRIVKEKTDKNYHDMDFNTSATSVEFIGKVKGVKMSLFTIFKVKGTYTTQDIDERSPFRQYIGYHDGYTYMIQYGEGDDERQIKYFKDIMNGEVAHILPYFEYIVS